MKKPGNISEFSADRDRELHSSFMEVLRTAGDVPLRRMFGMAASRPSSRFWVSETRAATVIGAMRRGVMPERMNAKRREMFEEIRRRAEQKMEADPKLCMTHAVAEAVNEPAPEFYLTPESARSIIYRIRERRKREAALSRMLSSKKIR